MIRNKLAALAPKDSAAFGCSWERPLPYYIVEETETAYKAWNAANPDAHVMEYPKYAWKAFPILGKINARFLSKGRPVRLTDLGYEVLSRCNVIYHPVYWGVPDGIAKALAHSRGLTLRIVQ